MKGTDVMEERTFLIKVKVDKDYNYSDIEQVLDSCAIVTDVELIEEYED